MSKRKNSISPWTREEKEVLIKLKRKGDYTSEEIAEILEEEGFPSRSITAINKCYSRINRDLMAARSQIAIKKMETLKKKNIKNTKNNIGKVNGPTKILVLTDMHIPFENEDALEEAINNNLDADMVVLGGDTLEVYSVSKWPKRKQLLLRHEYKKAFEFVKKLSELFPKVILIKGNHEERLDKYFSSNIDQNVSFLVEKDVLTRIVNGYCFDDEDNFCKVHTFNNVIYADGQTSWYTQIGKCIIAHPTGATGEGGKCVISAAKYFEARGIDFQCLVAGHTHQLLKCIRNNKLLIESGCLCAPMEYEGNSKVNYRPQVLAYTTIYMDKDGNVDFNKTDVKYLGISTVIEDKMIELKELLNE